MLRLTRPPTRLYSLIRKRLTIASLMIIFFLYSLILVSLPLFNMLLSLLFSIPPPVFLTKVIRLGRYTLDVASVRATLLRRSCSTWPLSLVLSPCANACEVSTSLGAVIKQVLSLTIRHLAFLLLTANHF